MYGRVEQIRKGCKNGSFLSYIINKGSVIT